MASIVLEKQKNFAQINPNAHIGKGNLYVVAFKEVINSTVFSGLTPKTGAVFFLVLGFNGLGAVAAK